MIRGFVIHGFINFSAIFIRFEQKAILFYETKISSISLHSNLI